jgi:PPOX class probable F420-dependent enzyme
MALTLDQAFEFVGHHTHGVLVTARRDGRPQLSNILYVPGDGHSVRVSVTDGRAKTKNLRRNPLASLHVTREDFYAYVVLDGEAALSPVAASPDDPVVDELVEMYQRAVGEHADWDKFRRSMVADRRLVLTLNGTRAYGMLGS